MNIQIGQDWEVRNGSIVRVTAAVRDGGYIAMTTSHDMYYVNHAGAAKGANRAWDFISVAQAKVHVEDDHDALTFHPLPVNPKALTGALKAPMSALPTLVMLEVGVAMFEGACKYGRHNYRIADISASVNYDGVMRHINAWWEGEDIDADSGMSHVTKAISALVVLRDSMISGRIIDDRPPTIMPAGFLENLNALTVAITERNADKSPRHCTIADK
jgi:hypothetical protein